MTTLPTTPVAPTAAAPARAVAAPRTVPQALRTARYALATTRTTLRNGMFVFFTVALPVLMFLMFNQIFGQEMSGEAGQTVGTFIMVRMAAYGGLGAAINAGAIIQIERTNGWLRQLMVAGLQPRSFVTGKLVAAMVVVLPCSGCSSPGCSSRVCSSAPRRPPGPCSPCGSAWCRSCCWASPWVSPSSPAPWAP